jgi:hypothetical protein
MGQGAGTSGKAGHADVARNPQFLRGLSWGEFKSEKWGQKDEKKSVFIAALQPMTVRRAVCGAPPRDLDASALPTDRVDMPGLPFPLEHLSQSVKLWP